MNLYLVRHTEVEWNKRGLFTAQAFNLRLNPTGLLEAERLAEKLDSVCFTGVLSSDQIRAVETGLVIAGRHAEIKFFKTDPRMREVNVGNLVGTRMSEVTEPTLKTKHPSFDFALIPDVIDGTEQENSTLTAIWPLGIQCGVPVWHLHESLPRLRQLCEYWPRVALGSSGEYAQIGTVQWWNRMKEAMDVACPFGFPLAKLHGLRMLDPEIFSRFPFSSADSTNVARNIGIDQAWRGPDPPANKAGRAVVLADRIESTNSAPEWRTFHIQTVLFDEGGS